MFQALFSAWPSWRESSAAIPIVAPTIVVFSDLSSFHFSWAEVIRTHAPKPTPDVGIVDNAFRRWARVKTSTSADVMSSGS